jgi:hypothetical protein
MITQKNKPFDFIWIIEFLGAFVIGVLLRNAVDRVFQFFSINFPPIIYYPLTVIFFISCLWALHVLFYNRLRLLHRQEKKKNS